MQRQIGASLAILSALIPPLAPRAVAQEAMPKFYVYGEDDGTPELTACKVSHASAIATLQDELSKAGITIQTDSNDPEAVMDTYINIAPLPIKGQDNCAYALAFAFESFNEAPNPFTGKTEFTKFAYCSKGWVLVWDRRTAQAEINSTLRRHVLTCLTKYKGRNAN